MEDKKEILEEFAEEAISEGVGAVIGELVAGPVGAVGGAVLGNATGKVFKKIAGEIRERYLSKNENKRINSVISGAEEKIKNNLKSGKELRTDNFFAENYSKRSTAEEILEGILLVAQREYEERKLPYLSNLYANIAFDKAVNRSMANQLLKISSDITFRQIIIIRIIGLFQTSGVADTRIKQAYKNLSGYNVISVASEIYDLYQRSIVFSEEAILDAIGINPSKLTLGGYGAMLYNLMELHAMPLDENAIDIIKFLTGSDSIYAKEVLKNEKFN